MAKNLLAVDNPFQLLPPPAGWLREMELFDDRLVLFPSQRGMTFILARRAVKSKGESPHDVKGLSQNPDTLIMAANRLVRVCEILPGVIWDMRVFQKLAAHDIQRQGGPTEVANKLEEMDRVRRDTLQKDQNDAVTERARDGYKAYQYKVGGRISLTPTSKHGRGATAITPNKVSVHAKPVPPAPLT